MQASQLVTLAMDRISDAIVDCDAAAVDAEEVGRVLAPVRDEHLRSPFIRRVHERPRGYPGDFETIQYLYEGQNKAQPNTLSYYCEGFALHGLAGQQHRHKLHHQAKLIERCVKEGAGQTAILSLASSACIDLSLAMPAIQSESFRLVVHDVDEGALSNAREVLSPIRERCEMLHGNLLKVLAIDAKASGPFDLVLLGGVCDYLTDKQVRIVLRQINRLLAPGGSVFFSNVAPHFVHLPWMQHLGGWSLVERPEHRIRDLVAGAGLRPERLSIQRDSTRLACLAEMRMAGVAQHPKRKQVVAKLVAFDQTAPGSGGEGQTACAVEDSGETISMTTLPIFSPVST